MALSVCIQAPGGKGRSADEEAGLRMACVRVCGCVRMSECVYMGVILQVRVGRIEEMASVSVSSWYSGREDVSALSVFVCVCVCVPIV